MRTKENITIPIYKPYLHGKEAEYVMDCVNTSWISSKGSYISKFEDKFKKFISGKYVETTTNGTTALHLALLALGIGPGDEVIVPTLTYIASVNAIKYVGALPVFVDSDINTWQMDTDEVVQKITKNTKAIMVVHLYGFSPNMEVLTKISHKYKIPLVEDCAEAFGTYYKGKHVGTFGAIAAFSFYGNKTITTGEGGIVVAHTKKLKNIIHRYKGQGLVENREYWHDIVGYNYRLTNICSAIGCAQLNQAKEILSRKRKIAKSYKKLLNHLPITMPEESKFITPSYWMVSILVPTNRDRDRLRALLLKNGVETRPLFFPIHTMPMYRDSKSYPIAEEIGSRGINLPSYPDLSLNNIQYIVALINQYFIGENK